MFSALSGTAVALTLLLLAGGAAAVAVKTVSVTPISDPRGARGRVNDGETADIFPLLDAPPQVSNTPQHSMRVGSARESVPAVVVLICFLALQVKIHHYSEDRLSVYGVSPGDKISVICY